jgi:ATP-dependent RNA helicase RhlE
VWIVPAAPVKETKVERVRKDPNPKAPAAPSTPAAATRAEPAKETKVDRAGKDAKLKASASASPPSAATRAEPAKETKVEHGGKNTKPKASAVTSPTASPRSPAPRVSQTTGVLAPHGAAGKEVGFQGLGLLPTLQRAVADAGYEQPTPIQLKAIPLVLAGRDVLGCAQTGTGKTAAFALPILQHLSNNPAPASIARPQVAGKKPATKRPIRALILSPTRELAIQIDESFVDYGKYTGLKSTVIFGGVGQDPQVKVLLAGVDVLVATPGRLLDLMGQGYVSINSIEIFVLDEADRMLDMGFIHDVRRVVKEIPKKRQTLLFSATMLPEIMDLANSILQDPVEVRVTPEKLTLEAISQALYFVPKKQKPLLLIDLLLKDKSITRALVFTRTKHGANQVVKKLVKAGIPALAIHGNKSQTARQKALGDFKDGNMRVLVATDVASRGIDVDDISHVIQYDLPEVPETYIHRMGRTGRMGAAGMAIAFCDEAERDCLKDIEKLIRMRIPVVQNHPFKP